MPSTLHFYDDPGLTVLTTSIAVTQAENGSAAPVDRVIYLGSAAANFAFLYKAESDPDVDNLFVNIEDSATGGGVQAGHVKLALDPESLDTAVAGAALDLDTFNFPSGVDNRIAIYIRVDTPALAAGEYSDVSLSTISIIEVPN